MNAIMVFPPFLSSRDAGGQIQRCFIKGLREINPFILCLDSDMEMPDYNIYKVKDNQVQYLLYRLLHRYNLASSVMVPDYLAYSWKNRAIKIAGDIVKSNKIDFVHSINNPCTSHVVAYHIKKQTGLPWIAQLYDPWHNNPFRKFRFGIGYETDAKLERLIAENADAILVPNDSLAKYWKDTYGTIISNKIHILPFVTEHPFECAQDSFLKDKLIVSHIGTLSEERNSKDFIVAVSRLLKENPLFDKKIQINYVGNVSRDEIKLINYLHLNKIFNLTGNLSEIECIQYYKESSLFLVVDLNVVPNVFYPSKLLKYFCYRKPIMAIVTEASTVEEEMRNTGNYSFKYGDVDGIKKFLFKAITEYPSILNNDTSYWERFMVENVEKQYMQIIKDITNS